MGKKKGKENKVLVLIDFENLIISAKNNIEPVQFSLESGFRKIIEIITKEIGEIVAIFAFLPSDRAIVWGTDLYELGFNIILCPRAKDKKGEEQDTTDSQLIKLGEWLIDHIIDLTHLCIGSGDKDFSPLMKKAALKGLKNVIVAADVRSLSSQLIKLTNTNPLTGRKMVYTFLPI